MSSASTPEYTNRPHRKAILGDPSKPEAFWLYDSTTGYNLTRPQTPTSPLISTAITIRTRDLPITIDPAKTALVIIDMQNYFLSPKLGRSPNSNGLKAQKRLIESAIPAARKAKIRTVWVNWGLTQDEVDEIPPATIRDFGFKTVDASQYDQMSDTERNRFFTVHPGPIDKGSTLRPEGLGMDLGTVTVDGNSIAAGRALMRDQWNSDLTPPLLSLFEEGQYLDRPDVRIHKNRISAFWDRETLTTEFLDAHGIKTLLFAGVNTDQCVGGSVQDAYYKGYDVVLLSDATGTTSPGVAQEGIEFNCTKTWGFCMDCEQFSGGVNETCTGA